MTISVPRTLAIAALLTTLLSGLLAETRWVEGGGESPRVGIFFDFDLEPSPASVAAMQREVGAVMAQAGAQLSWVLLKTEGATTTFDELAVLRFRGNCRAVKPHGQPAAARMMLGATEVAARHVTSYSDVQCDQIQSCVGAILNSFCPSERDEAFGRAMGRVAAHELYHILGRTTQHAHSGLTKALQTPFDLVRQDFQLDRETIQRLRERLHIKKGGEPPVIPTTRPATIAFNQRIEIP